MEFTAEILHKNNQILFFQNTKGAICPPPPIRNKDKKTPIRTKITAWPRSLDPFYILSYYMKWVKISWTESIKFSSIIDFFTTVLLYSCQILFLQKDFVSFSYSHFTRLLYFRCITKMNWKYPNRELLNNPRMI